ncbi:hypothetical protein F2P56_013026, partial [Juglans regia]
MPCLLDKLEERVSSEELEEISMVMRSIWLRRNEVVFKDTFKSPSQVMTQAKEELRTYYQAKQKLRQNTEPRVTEGESLWSKPRESFVKANWDGAVDKERKKVGLGVVIRDEEGEIMAAV